MYRVKEIFYTLQGEGTHAGRPAVFCRFSLCNLWSGRESDRHRAVCRFCDTDFVGTDGVNGGRFADAAELALAVAHEWPDPLHRSRMVVLTGGEPLLQVDGPLVDALHENGFFVAVETNGTRVPPRGLDWLCVSPKIGANLVAKSGDELKLVFPQAGGEPEQFTNLDFQVFRLQPMYGPDYEDNLKAAVDYCLHNPLWQLSLQTHKYLGIP